MATAVDTRVSTYSDTALLIGRVLLGALFVIAAYNKMMAYGGSTAYFTNLGIPAPALMTGVVLLFELVVGIALIVGYQTRMAALALGAFCIVSALIAHTNIADGNQLNHLLKNLAIAGGFLAVYVTGAGAYSIDARQGTA